METRANYALIGAFVIVAALAIAGFVLWLGQSQFQRDFSEYDVIFDGPVSLEEGSAVRFIGIKVGEVSTVRIDRGDTSKVRARIRVDRETPVKIDSLASVQLAGITGLTFVQLSAGTPTANALVASPGEPVPVIRSEPTQLDEIVRSGQQVLGDAAQTIERFNLLLTDENIASLTETIQHVESLSAQLAQEQGIAAQATTALQDISDAAVALEAASRDLQAFGKTADAQVGEIGEDVGLLVEDLREIVQSANQTVTESASAVEAMTSAIEGPGTGALEEVQRVGQDLRVLIARLDRLAREIEQNPQSIIVGDPAPYED